MLTLGMQFKININQHCWHNWRTNSEYDDSSNVTLRTCIVPYYENDYERSRSWPKRFTGRPFWA